MLRALSLGNFKAFAGTARLPIRPVTLIFGPNSAGKSSLIHGLALGHESLHQKNLDLARTKLGGDSVDLGGFRRYVHRHGLERHVVWGVEVDLPAETKGRFAELVGGRTLSLTITGGLPLESGASPRRHRKAVLQSYELRAGDERLLRMSAERDGQLRLDELTLGFLDLVWERAGVELSSRKNDRMPTEIDLQGAASRLSFRPLGLSRMQVSPWKRAPTKEARAALPLTSLVETLRGVLAVVESSLEAELGRLVYLGPLRSYPPRHMAFAQHDDPNWTAGGGRAWDRLRKSKALRAAVNTWLESSERLQTRYHLELDRFVAPRSTRGAVGSALKQIRKRLDAEEGWDQDSFVKLITHKLETDRSVEGDADLVLLDIDRKTAVSHRDVGIGISQVLPVLVEAYGNEERLVAIEQPEIHLHPRLQAELADVFLEGALGPRKNTFLLETHSEHLLLRLMRRIRETNAGKLPAGLPPVRPEDVAVVYVIPAATGARVLEIPLTPSGGLGGPWPGGFFPERMQELF